MTTGGNYGNGAGTDDQQVIRFELNANDLELEIEDATPAVVDLSFLVGGPGGSQSLSFNMPDLTISGGNTVDLSALTAPPQTLAINGQDLSISAGNTVQLPAATDTDHFDAFGQLIPDN